MAILTPECLCGQPLPRLVLAAGAYAGPLRQAVLALKFQGRTAGAPALAALMAPAATAWLSRTPLLVPVPLHAQRLRERGYNQAALLAHELALLHSLEVNAGTLRRLRNTAAQSTLDGAARRRNVERAFEASAACAGRTVVLIDDVCTTGATLQAAAAALDAAGACTVDALVLAATSYQR